MRFLHLSLRPNPYEVELRRPNTYDATVPGLRVPEVILKLSGPKSTRTIPGLGVPEVSDQHFWALSPPTDDGVGSVISGLGVPEVILKLSAP